MFKIEKEAHPSACIWYPKVDTKEDLLLTANDDYKMKIWNVSTKNSRRTCLGPTYGGEIVKLKKLDIDNNPDKFLVYATKKKVIGLIKMPLDGNPNKTMGLIAHPSDVEDICATSDGRYLFTCGGEDLAVNMWSIDVTPIDQAIALGGDGIEPFINLIEGGRDGQTYQDMKDFFYYSMIRSKDENTTKARRLNGRVPLEELPNLMRAMGYYPTQQEVDNMMDEVKFSNFAETGQHVVDVDLNTFIKLFVNHRPVYGIGKNNIQDAFAALLSGESSSKGGALNRDDLLRMLREEGEYMGQKEMEDSLNSLVGDSNFKTALPQEIQADDFAENILGFEEVEEVEGEEGSEEMGGATGFNGTGNGG